MIPRRFAAALAVLAALPHPIPASAADLTPDAAYTLVVRAPLSLDPFPKQDELAAACKVLEAQAAREPKNARWTFALAHVANAEAELATGDAAKNKRKEALERFQQAAELQPGSADSQFWLASASFDRVDDVGMFSKMSLASDGRKAFEKAIALDPGHVAARVGLAQFYLEAPGLAGGSIEKAKAQGDALLALQGRRGEYQGRMVLAGIAAHEENWAEMSRQFTAAETAAGDGADPVAALRSHAWSLLNGKKDAQAALPVVARYVKAAPSDDMTALFLDGEVKRQLGHCADASLVMTRCSRRSQERAGRAGAQPSAASSSARRTLRAGTTKSTRAASPTTTARRKRKRRSNGSAARRPQTAVISPPRPGALLQRREDSSGGTGVARPGCLPMGVAVFFSPTIL